MKIVATTNNTYLAAALCLTMAFLLTGCSDEDKPKEEVKATNEVPTQTTTAPSNFDHPHSSEVTDMEKHKFEHDFANQCVDRELKNASDTGGGGNADAIKKSCECIATYMMKDLTAQEAEKFIKEREHPQSLRIKFEAAAYQCLQENTKPAGPKMFGKPTSNNL